VPIFILQIPLLVSAPRTELKVALTDKAVSKAFMQYLAGTGDFININDWEEMVVCFSGYFLVNRTEFAKGNTDPIQVWEVLVDSGHLTELTRFTVEILMIISNYSSSRN
jgi:hypothetical protein